MRRLLAILTATVASFAITPLVNATYYGHPRRLGFPDQCFESLECTIAESALVVRATLQSETPDALVAVVTEAVKGSANVGSRISLGPGYSDSYLPGDDVVLLWHGTAQPALWRCYALDGQSVVMLMDLQKLTKPADILAAARSIAANQPSKIKTVALWSNGRMMPVPKNEHLQQLARQWATEKSVFKRLLAIQALSEFKSEENRKLIEPFLADTRTEKAHGISKWQVDKYTVREKATEVLAAWGTEPPLLPMSGPLLDYRPVNVSSVGYGLALASVLVILLACIILWQNAMLRRLFTTGVLIVIVLAIALLWWRSRTQVDEVMFGAGTSHHELSSYSGGIQYQVLKDWDDQRELVYGSFDREMHDDVWSINAQNPKSRHSLLGFAYASDTAFGPGGSIHRSGVLRIPYWMPLVLILVPLAFNLRALARPIIRRRLGLCRHCGYDLRENPSGVCPECGNQIPSSTPAASDLLLQTRNEMPIGGQPIGM